MFLARKPEPIMFDEEAVQAVAASLGHEAIASPVHDTSAK